MIIYYENETIKVVCMFENAEFEIYKKMFISDEIGLKLLTGELNKNNYFIKNEELIHKESNVKIIENKIKKGNTFNLNLQEIKYSEINPNYIIENNYIKFINKNEVYVVDKNNPFYCIEIIKESKSFNYDLDKILLLSSNSYTFVLL